MRRPGANHLDRRRRLLPRDYLLRPDGFGFDHDAQKVIPDNGDGTSATIAMLQHHLVRRWRGETRRPSGAELGRRFGFSKQTWSRTVLGQRWMGETVAAALIFALRSGSESPPQQSGHHDGSSRSE